MQAHGIHVHAQSGPGFGRAMLEGMHLAKGDIVVEFTPDGNAIPRDIPRIIARCARATTSSSRPATCPAPRARMTTGSRTGNWLFSRIVNLMFGTRYTDVLIGFRAYRARRSRLISIRRAELAVPELASGSRTRGCGR